MLINPIIEIPNGQSCQNGPNENYRCRFLLFKSYCILFDEKADINQKCQKCIERGRRDNP